MKPCASAEFLECMIFHTHCEIGAFKMTLTPPVVALDLVHLPGFGTPPWIWYTDRVRKHEIRLNFSLFSMISFHLWHCRADRAMRELCAKSVTESMYIGSSRPPQ